jgi:hypothetical protein
MCFYLHTRCMTSELLNVLDEIFLNDYYDQPYKLVIMNQPVRDSILNPKVKLQTLVKVLR